MHAKHYVHNSTGTSYVVRRRRAGLGLCSDGSNGGFAANQHTKESYHTECVLSAGLGMQAWGLNFLTPPPPAGGAAVLAGIQILSAYQVCTLPHPVSY